MRESVDSTIATFMRFSKRRRMTEPNHPLGLRICDAMKCLSVTISPQKVWEMLAVRGNSDNDTSGNEGLLSFCRACG